MSRMALVLFASLFASVLAVVAPVASACHGTEPNSEGSWSTGTPTKSEVLGVGSTGVGTYTAPRAGYCGGESYATYCAADPVTLTTVATPEVRVLGETVVPASSTPVKVDRVRFPCLAGLYGQTEVGVYADNVPGGGSTSVGTNSILWLDGVTLP